MQTDYLPNLLSFRHLIRRGYLSARAVLEHDWQRTLFEPGTYAWLEKRARNEPK